MMWNTYYVEILHTLILQLHSLISFPVHVQALLGLEVAPSLDILLPLLSSLDNLLLCGSHSLTFCACSNISHFFRLSVQHLSILVCSSRINTVNPSLIEQDQKDNVIPETCEAMHYENGRSIRVSLRKRVTTAPNSRHGM